MTDELGRALRALAADAAAAHSEAGGLPTARLQARARRSRRARAVAAGAGSVLVVGALLLAVTRPEQTPTPAPATSPTSATPSPSASPSATASVAPVVLPSGDSSLPWGACGSLVTATPAAPVDPRFEATVLVEDPELVAGRPLTVSTWVEPRSDELPVALVPAAGPRLLAVRDGVVVGITGVYGADTDLGWSGRILGAELDTTFLGPVDLAVCDDGGDAVTAGRALPAGSYELYAWAEVGELSDDPSWLEADLGRLSADLVQEGGQLHSAVSAPVALTVVGEAEWPSARAGRALDGTPGAPLPTCGGPVPAGATRAAGLGASLGPVTTAEVAEGEELDPGATVRVTYDGPGVLQADVDLRLSYWIVRDGVVVGTSWLPGDAGMTSLRMATDGTFEGAATSFVPTTCDEYGQATSDALPPGTYTVHPGLWVSVREIWTSEETYQLPSLDQVVVFTEPFELTVR